MLGLYLSNSPGDDIEVAAVSPILDKYRSVVSEIIVGNEALVSEQVSARYLTAKISAVKQTVLAHGLSTPVGTVETPPFWLDSTSFSGNIVSNVSTVIEVADFLGINYHPYYGRVDPLITDAGTGMVSSVGSLRSRWNKSVIVTEYGFPTAGPPNLGIQTAPSDARLEATILSIEAARRKSRTPAYMFEAFDGVWKMRWSFPGVTSDSIEYHWGLLTCDRKLKNIRLPPGTTS
jgi:exo-beta-1,3-glucanase (GH17 family)